MFYIYAVYYQIIGLVSEEDRIKLSLYMYTYVRTNTYTRIYISTHSINFTNIHLLSMYIHILDQ